MCEVPNLRCMVHFTNAATLSIWLTCSRIYIYARELREQLDLYVYFNNAVFQKEDQCKAVYSNTHYVDGMKNIAFKKSTYGQENGHF